jgi:transcriptional regulator with XRE-family HTH domain
MTASVVPADSAATDTAKIGQRLKAVRRAQRRTLEEVAEASGLTKGFLSKIERDLASASVAALLRICATLNVPLASLFENDSTGEVVRSGSYPRIDFGGQDLAEYLLTPPAERRIQVIMSEVQPGGGSGNEGYSLPAEVEFVYVVSGALDLGFAERTIRLGAGDAFTFDPSTPHTFRAADPAAPTTVMWVLCPALAAADPGDPSGGSRAAYAARIAGSSNPMK